MRADQAQMPRSSVTAPEGAAGLSLGLLLPVELVSLVIVCGLLAALSAAVLPTVPSYDPWSWIVWGREVFDSQLSFSVSGGPSWKPLPVCFTAIYGLFGSAAPALWVITARAGGLLGLVAAFRLGRTLTGRVSLGGSVPAATLGGSVPATGAGARPDWLGALAGAIAPAGIVLTQDWASYMYRGASEPMLIACCLWAVDRYLAGRRGSSFVLLVAASLIRPEAWPFLFGYGIWLWLRVPRLRGLVLAGWLAIPLLWFVPPWVGSGQPFLAASHAKSYNGHLGSSPFLTALKRMAGDQVLPALIAGVAAVALAWWRGRDRVVAVLAGCVALWWAIVVAMTVGGYPGLERFFLPGAALTCVLAGAGIVAVARLASQGAGGPRGRSAAGAVAAGLVALSIPLASARVSGAWAQRAAAASAVRHLDELSKAAAAVGGHHGVYPCRSSFAAVNHGAQTALAWKLHVTLGRVGTAMRHQGVLFVGPWDAVDGARAPIAPELTERRLVARVGMWRIYRVTAPGADTRCVGAA